LSLLLLVAFLPVARTLALTGDAGADSQTTAAQDQPKKDTAGKATTKKKKAKAKAGQQNTLDEKYQADAQEKPAQKTLRFEFQTHPAVRIGTWLRVDFRLKFQHDFRIFDPEFGIEEGELSNLRRFTVGVEGYVTKNFEYRVERDIRDEVAGWLSLRARETRALWRDVFGNWRYFRRVQIRAGQFKIPFGMDQQHGGDFVNRSLIGNYLAPGRELGIMAHGKLLDSRVSYQAGLFLHDGWKAHLKTYERSGERTFAGRLVLPPFAMFNAPCFLKPFKDLQLGGAFAQSPVTEGLRSLRGRTWVITHTWFDRVNVRGHRLRLGAELNWEPGPFFARGEVTRVSDQRLGQGIRGDDLPDLIGRGWYFSTGWVVTGEKTAGGVTPRKSFVRGRGIGAVELAARYEQMRFGSAEHPGLPSRSSRAANIVSESERIATFGVNWYLNRFVKIQFNAYREVIEDLQKVPIAGEDTYWSHYVRIQFVF
jgi:phosphate-selective porin